MKIICRSVIAGLLLIGALNPLFAEEKLVNRQLLELIDIPTAGTLPHKAFSIDMRMYPNGGFLGKGAVGALDRFDAAIHFGGENLIGDGSVNWNPQIGIDIRVRVIDESNFFPGVALGFSTQGWGGYNKEFDRYSVKARGFYLVASRNYWLFGNLGFHAGLNKSLENDDKDEDFNVFVGMDKALFKGIEFLIDYDFALNDNESVMFGEGHGYLNAGLRIGITNNYYFEFDFKNLTKNRPDIAEISREIKFGFIRTF